VGARLLTPPAPQYTRNENVDFRHIRSARGLRDLDGFEFTESK
jgi:hypothetical protein